MSKHKLNLLYATIMTTVLGCLLFFKYDSYPEIRLLLYLCIAAHVYIMITSFISMRKSPNKDEDAVDIILSLVDKHKRNKEDNYYKNNRVVELLTILCNDYLSSKKKLLNKQHSSLIACILYTLCTESIDVDMTSTKEILAENSTITSITTDVENVSTTPQQLSKRYWLLCSTLAIMLCTSQEDNEQSQLYVGLHSVTVLEDGIHIHRDNKEDTTFSINLTVSKSLRNLKKSVAK